MYTMWKTTTGCQELTTQDKDIKQKQKGET